MNVGQRIPEWKRWNKNTKYKQILRNGKVWKENITWIEEELILCDEWHIIAYFKISPVTASVRIYYRLMIFKKSLRVGSDFLRIREKKCFLVIISSLRFVI